MTKVLLTFFRALFFALWPVAVMAGPMVQDPLLTAISGFTFIVVCVCAVLGAASGTCHRMLKEADDPKANSKTHPSLFILANMLGGVVAGLAVYFTSAEYLKPLFIPGLVLLSGWGGEIACSRLFDRFYQTKDAT